MDSFPGIPIPMVFNLETSHSFLRIKLKSLPLERLPQWLQLKFLLPPFLIQLCFALTPLQHVSRHVAHTGNVQASCVLLTGSSWVKKRMCIYTCTHTHKYTNIVSVFCAIDNRVATDRTRFEFLPAFITLSSLLKFDSQQNNKSNIDL